MNTKDRPKVQCPSCLQWEIEPLLDIHHGVFRDPDRASYWWKNHGVCFVTYPRLMKLGWYPKGWGPRKHLIEPGEVLTTDQKDRLERAFRRGIYDRDIPYGRIAGEAAEVLRPVVLKRLPSDLDGYALMNALDRACEHIEQRVEAALRKAVATAEEEGFPVGGGASIDRALQAAIAATVSSGNES